MRSIPSLLIMILVLLSGCDKDKFTTTPQVEITSINPETVISGSLLVLEGKYTDQEGDIDTILIVRKYYFGDIVTRTDTLERFAFDFLGVPEGTRQAEFQVTFEYNTANTGQRTLSGVQKDTTATLGIVMKDLQQNRSEFKESEKIRLIKP